MNGFEKSVDVLNAKAVEEYFHSMAGPILQDAGELAGKTLTPFYSVSWEGAIPTWTPGFEHEFAKYRGYSPVRWLPVTTAARLFLGAGSMASEVAGSLQPEIEGPRALGGFVAPESVADLIDFLTTQGPRIIRAASRHGQGAAAALVLKKIRECAVYAQRSGSGYLEGSGLLPPDLTAES